MTRKEQQVTSTVAHDEAAVQMQISAKADIGKRMQELIEDIRRVGFPMVPRDHGFGKRPALIVVDLANFWTQPKYGAYCAHTDAVIDNMSPVLEACRAADIPVIFTTMGYHATEGPTRDSGVMHGTALKMGSDAIEIDSRLDFREGDQLVVKKAASAFSGTYLQTYLHTQGVDTVLITGVVTSGCIRATAADALALGFQPIVVSDCVDDRLPGGHEWTLFDIEAKIGDVYDSSKVVEYLGGLCDRATETSSS